MVTLRTGFTTLTFLRTSQLLEFAVKLLNRPASGILVANGLRVDWVWIIGDNPVNVAVCGDYLEQLDAKRQLLEFDQYAVRQAFGGPVDVLHTLDIVIVVLSPGWNQRQRLFGRDQGFIFGKRSQGIESGIFLDFGAQIVSFGVGRHTFCVEVKSLTQVLKCFGGFAKSGA